MKFSICIIIVCINNAMSFKFKCTDFANNVANDNVFLIHSYGLSYNNTLTNFQKSLFLIRP